jgi:excisionase family DNA binding protein
MATDPPDTGPPTRQAVNPPVESRQPVSERDVESRTAEDDYPPVLDAAQVARLLQLNIDYVRKLSREGVLPAHKLPGGRTFRYFKEEVLDWLRDQSITQSEPQADVPVTPDGGPSDGWRDS